MTDMQREVEDECLPWEPTPLDLVLFLRGWDAGEKWEQEIGSGDKRKQFVE
jgi:hypothetical protein